MNDERIRSQEAFFGVHISHARKNDVFIPISLEKRLFAYYQSFQERRMENPETPFAIKILYPYDLHEDMQIALARRGITELHIYPDLGTAAKLAWKEV